MLAWMSVVVWLVLPGAVAAGAFGMREGQAVRLPDAAFAFAPPARVDAAAASQLRVSLMQEHNEAIAEWMAAQRSGVVARSFALVHFDSHPDMAMPRRPFAQIEQAAASGRSERVATLLNIDEFIVAACKLGMVDHVIWVRPPWADTLSFPGTVQFHVATSSDGHLVGDYPLPYYVLGREGRMYRNQTTAGASGAAIRLTVLRHDELETLPELLRGREPGGVVVDFDLDYLSTLHPAVTLAATASGVGSKRATDFMVLVSFAPRINRWLASKLGFSDAAGLTTLAGKQKLWAHVSSLEVVYDDLLVPAPWATFVDKFHHMLDFIGCPPHEAADIIRMLKATSALDGVDVDIWQQWVPRLLTFAYGVPAPRNARRMVAGIGGAMQQLRRAMGGNAPGLVTVCRSVGSGFTPEGEAAQFYADFMHTVEAAFGRPLVRVRRPSETQTTGDEWLDTFSFSS
jgi:hypothetical protein